MQSSAGFLLGLMDSEKFIRHNLLLSSTEQVQVILVPELYLSADCPQSLFYSKWSQSFLRGDFQVVSV